MCLITKDPQREYKDLLAAKNVKGITRVRARSPNRRIGGSRRTGLTPTRFRVGF